MKSERRTRDAERNPHIKILDEKDESTALKISGMHTDGILNILQHNNELYSLKNSPTSYNQMVSCLRS